MILAHNQHHKPFLGLDNNNNYKNFLLHKSEMHSIPLISNKEDYRLKKVSILNTLNTLYKITLWNKFLKFAKPFSIHFFSVLAIYSVSEKNEAIFSSWLTFYTHLKSWILLIQVTRLQLQISFYKLQNHSQLIYFQF